MAPPKGLKNPMGGSIGSFFFLLNFLFLCTFFGGLKWDPGEKPE